MSDFQIMNRDQEAKNYWEGKENKIIRWWVYAQKGLQEFNEFKYFVLALAAFVALLYPLDVKPDFNISLELVIVMVI